MDREGFYSELEKWIAHSNEHPVPLNSTGKEFLDCDSYRNLVSMGEEILPLIGEVYQSRPNEPAEDMVYSPGLSNLVWEIMGDRFEIPENIRGKFSEMAEYTKNWLEDHIPT